MKRVDLPGLIEPTVTVSGLIRQTNALFRTRLDALLRPHGLTAPQYECLRLLRASPGISNSDLARGAFVTRQSMNVLLRTLDERGLIERATVPILGRVLPTHISPAGLDLVGRIGDEVDDLEHRMTAALTGSQVATLREALQSCQVQLATPSAQEAGDNESRDR